MVRGISLKMFWVLYKKCDFKFNATQHFLIACPREIIYVEGLFERHGVHSS